jgi:hypothetical protein
MSSDPIITSVAVSSPRDDRVAFVRRMRARRDQGRWLRLFVNLGIITAMGACAWAGCVAFARFGCRSQQTEAQGLLKRVAGYEIALRNEHGGFGPPIDERPPGKRRYVLVPGRVTATSFEAFALAVDDPYLAHDLWRVTDTSPPEVVHDACNR